MPFSRWFKMRFPPQVPGLKLRVHDLEQRLSLAEVAAEEAKSRLQTVSADASRCDV